MKRRLHQARSARKSPRASIVINRCIGRSRRYTPGAGSRAPGAGIRAPGTGTGHRSPRTPDPGSRSEIEKTETEVSMSARRQVSARPARRRLLRAAAAFLALPGVVAGGVPLLIALPAIRAAEPFRLVALVPLVCGLALLLWCTRVFLVIGHGTLAPWEPPRALVTTGPYRVTRNPMYVAVVLILLGWAAGFASWGLLAYAVLVLIAFQLRIVRVEEPVLAETYRDSWRKYSARVPRWAF